MRRRRSPGRGASRGTSPLENVARFPRSTRIKPVSDLAAGGGRFVQLLVVDHGITVLRYAVLPTTVEGGANDLHLGEALAAEAHTAECEQVTPLPKSGTLQVAPRLSIYLYYSYSYYPYSTAAAKYTQITHTTHKIAQTQLTHTIKSVLTD